MSVIPRIQGRSIPIGKECGNTQERTQCCNGSIRPVLESPEERSCSGSELQRDLSLVRDELAAWAVYFQQQKPGISGDPENPIEPEQMPNTPVTVLTAMASKGDVEIEVTDPDRYPL